MIERRPFNELMGADRGWLKAKHHFSFGEYGDPARMGWGSLRIWNDDEIAPNAGFPPHAHANMEIITYVREGAVTHRDSLGNEGRTEVGDVQVMSAGTGIRHAEYNLEQTPTRIFQIWIRARARVLGATLKTGETVEYALGERRHGYLVPASGAVEINGVRIAARDGAAIKDVAVLEITAIEDSEVVLVDTP